MPMIKQLSENIKKEYEKEDDLTMDVKITENSMPEKDMLDEAKKQAAQETGGAMIRPEDIKTTSQAEIDAEAEELRKVLKAITQKKAKLSQQRRENDAKKIRCAGVGMYLLAHDRGKFNELLERHNFHDFIEAQNDKELDKHFGIVRKKAG